MVSIAEAGPRLRDIALAYPDTVEDHPWGHDTYKVRGKMFLSVSSHEGKLYITVKLPGSFEFALDYGFAAPAGYGLGKARWITSTFRATDDVPLDILSAWVDESFRAIAPKSVVKRLPARRPGL